MLEGESVVKLAATGQYREAFRRAHLLGERYGQTRYALLLLIAWMAVEKAKERRTSGDSPGARHHYQAAKRAVDEALGVDPRDCFLEYWLEKPILAIAQGLTDEGWVDQAVGVIERFGKEATQSQNRWEGVGYGSCELACNEEQWDRDLGSRRHVSHYLAQLARSASLERDARLRLLDQARGWADDVLNSPDYNWDWAEESATIAVIYAELGLPEQAGEIYGGLLEEWVRKWGLVAAEQKQRELKELVEALDPLLDGLEKLLDAPWVADWCQNLKIRVELLPAPDYQPALQVRLARACLIAGDSRGVEWLLTQAMEGLGRGTASDTVTAGFERFSGLWPKVSEQWRDRHLPQIIRLAHEGIVRILDETFRREFRRFPSRWVGRAEEGLRALTSIECVLIRELACLNSSHVKEARQSVAESIRAIRGCSKLKMLKALTLFRMGFRLYEIGEIDLATDAMAHGVSSRIENLTLDDLRVYRA